MLCTYDAQGLGDALDAWAAAAGIAAGESGKDTGAQCAGACASRAAHARARLCRGDGVYYGVTTWVSRRETKQPPDRRFG